MSGGFESGGKGSGSPKAKKGGGFLDGLRAFGSSVLEGFVGGGMAPPAGGRPRDPVAARERPAAARQIHRSMKAWRDKEAESSEEKESTGAQGDESADAKSEAPAEPAEAGAADKEALEATAGGDDSVKAEGDSEDAKGGDESEQKEGGGEQSAETSDEQPLEIAAKPISVAAKLKGIHRKVFRRAEDERTPGVGVMLGPIKQKIQQALTMVTVWTSNADPDVADNAKKLKAALTEIKTDLANLEATPPRGAALTAAKNAIQTKCDGLQKLDPKYRLYSIEAAGRCLNSAKEQMGAVTVVFENKADMKPMMGEYVSQLRDQQAGINSMLVSDWKKNRTRFETNKAGGGDGRSPEGSRMQKEYGKRFGNPAGKVASHNSDQIAGGNDDPTGLPSEARVNSAIGGSWPASSRIGAVDKAVDAIPASDRGFTQMNVVLNVTQL